MEGRFCGRCKQTKSEDEFYTSKKWACKECSRQYCREYKARNKQKISEYNYKYKREHREEISKYNKRYNKENRKTIQRRHTAYLKKRRYSNPEYKFELISRARIRSIIKQRDIIKTDTTKNLLGCDYSFFLIWLEYQFDSDMTFDNHGTVWHVDHVIPCAKFNNLDDIEQRRCFNWTNCQPLKALDNYKKNRNACPNEITNHKKKIRRCRKLY